MGEYADERLDWEMGNAGVPGYGRQRRKSSPIPQFHEDVWTMKDGTKIKFEDMEPAHRMNCINLLIERHGEAVAEASYTVRRLRELGAGYYFN